MSSVADRIGVCASHLPSPPASAPLPPSRLHFEMARREHAGSPPLGLLGSGGVPAEHHVSPLASLFSLSLPLLSATAHDRGWHRCLLEGPPPAAHPEPVPVVRLSASSYVHPIVGRRVFVRIAGTGQIRDKVANWQSSMCFVRQLLSKLTAPQQRYCMD
ncbi:hypothetical protein ABZP36_013583 [Zizania latifolia]